MANWQHLTVEWLWDSGNIRINFPDNKERKLSGSYSELVQAFNDLGKEGWEAVSCASGGNWLFWTFKRSI